MKQELSAKQALSLPAFNSLLSVSMAIILRGIPAQHTSLSQLDPQAFSLAASCTIVPFPLVTAAPPTQSRPNCVVPTFVSTFSTPISLLQNVLLPSSSNRTFTAAVHLALVNVPTKNPRSASTTHQLGLRLSPFIASP